MEVGSTIQQVSIHMSPKLHVVDEFKFSSRINYIGKVGIWNRNRVSEHLPNSIHHPVNQGSIAYTKMHKVCSAMLEEPL